MRRFSARLCTRRQSRPRRRRGLGLAPDLRRAREGPRRLTHRCPREETRMRMPTRKRRSWLGLPPRYLSREREARRQGDRLRSISVSVFLCARVCTSAVVFAFLFSPLSSLVSSLLSSPRPNPSLCIRSLLIHTRPPPSPTPHISPYTQNRDPPWIQAVHLQALRPYQPSFLHPRPRPLPLTPLERRGRRGRGRGGRGRGRGGHP